MKLNELVNSSFGSHATLILGVIETTGYIGPAQSKRRFVIVATLMRLHRRGLSFILILALLPFPGCVSDPYKNARFTQDAVKSRCGVPTVKQLTALPPLPIPLPSRPEPVGALALSPSSSRLAHILELEDVLHELAALDAVGNPTLRERWLLLWRHQQIMDRISLASFDVISTVTEIDCEETRADHVAHGLTEIRQDKQERALFLALIGDALIGVVAGAFSLAGKATVSAANAIAGGSIAVGLGGAATIFLGGDHEFLHPRNHLTELWADKQSSALFPHSVWRYLNTEDESGLTIRRELLYRWGEEQRLGALDSEQARARAALFLSEGGTYEIQDLRIRSEMLNHLKSAVLRMGQDLNVLMYEVMAIASYDAPLVAKP